MAVAAEARRSTTGSTQPPPSRRTDFRFIAGLAVAFALTRVIYFAAGVRLSFPSGLQAGTTVGSKYPWQLLAPHLLRADLASSIWHLIDQPPIFNLSVGLLMKLPNGLQEPVVELVFLLLGLVIVLGSYLVMVELGLPSWVAGLVALLIVIDPAYVLYENWLFYAYPTCALLVVSAWCCVRYLRARAPGWGVAFFCSVCLVVMLNSTYQLPWLLLVVAAIVFVNRRLWRRVLLIALPCLLVVGWVAKDTAQVGTVTTSSWFGMNFARTTLDTQLADPAALRGMVRDHVLTPIAETWPFSSVGAYVPHFVKTHHTGSAALDSVSVNSRLPNYNNIIYVSVSAQYLHNDLAFVQAQPGIYARAVIDASKVWVVPPDEYFELQANRSHISAWADIFDRTVLLRPAADPKPVATAVYYVGWLPNLSQISYMTAIVDAIALLGIPIFLWRRRKRASQALAGTLLYMWVTLAYAFTVTSLVELGENQRFAMELGPLPLLAACVLLWNTFGNLGRENVSDPSVGQEAGRGSSRDAR